MKIFVLGALLLLSAPSIQAQSCFDDLRYDNDTFENAFGSFSPGDVHFVMRLDPPANSLLQRVCLCWIASQGRDLKFDLLVWDDDGPSGAPGTLLAQFDDLVVEDVPFTPPGAFYALDLAEQGFVAPGSIYVGPRWSNSTHPGFFLCADYDGPSTQPGYWDTGGRAGDDPPEDPLGVDPPFDLYVALGLRAAFDPFGVALSDAAELIVPGFLVDLANPAGATTFVGLRNTSAETIAFDLEYHGLLVEETPRRVDAETLTAGKTRSFDVRDDPTDLDPDGDDLAEGLLLVRRAAGSSSLEGDYFRVDFDNDFAVGERMVRPEDFCSAQEIRFLDFGDGTIFRILLDRPLGDAAASFSYEILDQAGVVVAEGEHFTQTHLNVISIDELSPGQKFGTAIFDFSASSSGWVSATYSAFGRFSAEMNGACRSQSSVD